jgi:hypothetical protein
MRACSVLGSPAAAFRTWTASHHGSNAREQLAHAERLRDVVVHGPARRSVLRAIEQAYTELVLELLE